MIHLLVWLQLLMIVQSLEPLEDKTKDGVNRVNKQLSVFSVVKFPNTVCLSTTSGRNGTCYTTSECTAKGGRSSGSCAASFGVCCVFEKSCGAGSYSENSTYFTSTDISVGSACVLTICKSRSDVCQLRLDFETFGLNNPVTVTTTTNLADATAGASNSLGLCATDTFSVSAPGAKAPPVICGTNTGQHLYVPASDSCNLLSANIGTGSSATTSSFTIKITQIECSSKTKAPDGCSQYFTGTTGTISTFNYNAGTGVLLNDQHYSTCIRAERTICTICYFAAITDFKMSVFNEVAAIGLLGFDTVCGFSGHNAPATNVSDHIQNI